LAHVALTLIFAYSAVAGAALAYGAPPVATATITPEDQSASARRLFREGLGHADAGRWREAADSFTRAYSIRPSPEIAYNLSTSLTHLDRLVSSAELLRQVASDPDATPPVRAAAEARLAQVLPRLAHLTIELRAADGGQLWLDGRPLDRLAVGTPVAVDPGSHLVELRSGAHATASRALSLDEGAHEVVVLGPPPLGAPAERAPVALAPVPARETTERPLWRRGWFLGAAGVATVGAAVAIFFAARGSQDVRGNVDTWVIPR
jgi:hypothetical protein